MGNSIITDIMMSSSNHRQSLKSKEARLIGNSCVAGSSQSNQGHCQESNGSEITFKWRIDGFSSLLDKGKSWTNSSVFEIRGHNWHLMLNPRDRKSGDENEYVSLMLVLFQVSERSHTAVEATFKLYMTSHMETTTNSIKVGSSLYPSGSDKNGNHLSLYLSMKVPFTLHHDSANLAEISISIKDQETGKHRKSSGRFQFKNSSSTWGWEKFISLEDFKDSSKGYLVKTKCCIEAQVAVIGSSKTE